MDDKANELYQSYLKKYLNQIFEDKEVEVFYHTKKKDIMTVVIPDNEEIGIQEYFEYELRDDGIAIVEKDGEYNLIDKYGRPILKEWCSFIRESHNLFLVVGKRGEYIVDKYGIRRSKYYGCISYFKEFGYTFVKYGKGTKLKNYIDKKGVELLDWQDTTDYLYINKPKRINNTFQVVCRKKEKYISSVVDFKDYHVRSIVSGYICYNKKDKYHIKYDPLVIYDKRYTLCLRKDEVYLYDRTLNEYSLVGKINNVELKEHFIYDNTNDRIYFIYDEKKIDITEYYNKKLKSKDNIRINEGIKFLSLEQFFYEKENEIKAKAEQERRRKEQEELEKKKTDEQRELERIQREKIISIKLRQTKRSEGLRLIKKGFELLKETGNSIDKSERIKVDDLLIDYGEYKEINPDYLKKGILKIIDLSDQTFKDVKMNGIDFSGTNVSLFPQLVLNRDLSYCNLEGIHITPFMDFTGVNICGTKFSDDENIISFKIFNSTFENAIYNEETTYNGTPIIKFIKERDKQKRKV